MRELIQSLVETEKEAQHIVDMARGEANRIVTDARKQAEITVEDARRDARQEGAQIIARAVEAAQGEKKKRLEEARAAIQGTMRWEPEEMEKWISAVVRCVCGL